MFTFCPLQGALSESTASQSLLELDGGVKVLIDVGWDESFNVGMLRELEKHIPTLSLILLTHATVPHLAAYAYCCKNFPLFTRVPVYATRPVIDLGRNLTQDLYSSTPAAATTISPTSLAQVSYSYSQTPSDHGDFLVQAPTPEEIARYFSLIQALKYSQPHQPLPSPFSPPLNGLAITAYNSGRTLGGTIWHIQHGLESIVYAVDWNQTRENVFSGAAWLGGGLGGGAGGTEVIEQLRKPTALVCSSRTTEASMGRARRDEQLLESLKLCVARGGTVLIPVDSSARVLELAYLLEHAWRIEVANRNKVFQTTKLYLAGRNMSSTMRNARSMLEWMDDSVVREFEATADGGRRANGAGHGAKEKAAGPFDFEHLRLLERKAQIEHVVRQGAEDDEPRGKVILASDSSLEWGFSKDVFKMIASDARNLVILTERPSASIEGRPSIGRTLWEWWKERKDGLATEETSSGDKFEQVYGGGRDLDIAVAERRALEGNELDVYQQWLATQKQLQATLHTSGAATLECSADAVDEASSEFSDDSDESDTEHQGKALNHSTTMGQASRKKVVLKDEDLGINILLKKKGVHDFDVRGKKGRERMFPLAIRRKRHDDFGELIRPEEYLRAEEREEMDGADTSLVNFSQGEELGKKRKWDNIGGRGKGQQSGSNKHPPRSRNVSDEGAAAAFADGPGGDELDRLGLDDDEGSVQGPCKLVMFVDSVKVHLRIAFVDLSGLHDRRSLNMLIPLIQPRKLVLVAGSQDETTALAADCKRLLGAQLGTSDERAIDVFTPAVGETVDASVDTHAWVVKLADPLVRRLKWQKVRDLGIVTLTGILVRRQRNAHATDQPNDRDEDSANKRIKLAGEQTATSTALVAEEQDPIPTLDVLPAHLVSAARSAARPLHVGDLRLGDLRRAMLAAGHAAEFRGEGILVIDGGVAVRKTTAAGGRIEIESVGLLTDGTRDGTPWVDAGSGGTFHAVKKVIYESLAVVAGA